MSNDDHKSKRRGKAQKVSPEELHRALVEALAAPMAPSSKSKRRRKSQKIGWDAVDRVLVEALAQSGSWARDNGLLSGEQSPPKPTHDPTRGRSPTKFEIN